jgi:hypothetical protein
VSLFCRSKPDWCWMLVHSGTTTATCFVECAVEANCIYHIIGTELNNTVIAPRAWLEQNGPTVFRTVWREGWCGLPGNPDHRGNSVVQVAHGSAVTARLHFLAAKTMYQTVYSLVTIIMIILIIYCSNFCEKYWAMFVTKFPGTLGDRDYQGEDCRGTTANPGCGSVWTSRLKLSCRF